MRDWVGQAVVFFGLGMASVISAPADLTNRQHWSFQPVQSPAVPEIRNATESTVPLDRFILARLEKQGAQLSAPADKRTLLRRATYDLTGLPPTIAELDSFTNDHSTNAFGRVVERLLASPRYGEQWGRHWLDVVRYADTAGENTDHPLPQAWRYRNWVINAFNTDKPYDEFIREQIAGDLLASSGPPSEFEDRIVATGYLAIARRFGHDIDKDMHLTLEDTIDNVGKAILGLSISCARCHNHKYDPITARDYYGLYGIFESTRFAFPGCEQQQRTRDLVPMLPASEAEALKKPYEKELAKLNGEVKRQETELAAKRKVFDDPARTALGSGDLTPAGAQEFVVGDPALSNTLVPVKRGEMLQLSILPKANHGADSTGIELEISEQGGSHRVWNVTKDVLDDFYENGAGAQHGDHFGNQRVWHFYDLAPSPLLFTQFVRDEHKTSGLQVWRGAEGVPSAFVNITTQTIRFVTVTMPPRTFGLHPGPKGGVAVAWESPIDGVVNVRGKVFKMDPGGDGVAWRLEKRAGISAALGAQKFQVLALSEAKKKRDDFMAKAPPIPVAYAVSEGIPTNAPVQKRGDPTNPGEVVPRKFLDLLGGQQLKATNSSGRLELAQWLTNPTNPLTARVMVNRIWQGHFGRGIVAPPNDFGTRGEPPTHPELLDYLAIEFIKSGWNIKAMHRLIMLSATYQQSSFAADLDKPEHDATTHLNLREAAQIYASFPRRRLTAEELRDTLLAISGELDLKPGQAHPFPPEDKWSFTQHGPFAADYDTTKRSVYVMQKRNRRGAFFALFDGADPNASTATRDITTVPTQALYFMNDPFVHARAGKFADRVTASASDDGDRLDYAYYELFDRAASVQERSQASQFLRDYAATCSDQPAEKRSALAWAAYTRVLLASNELLYVD